MISIILISCGCLTINGIQLLDCRLMMINDIPLITGTIGTISRQEIRLVVWKNNLLCVYASW
jgi:hypothetical protein